jgi:hypothetical protein
MIILVHGTGDDNSKPENWIRWVAEIMDMYGDITLTVPGVESGEQAQLGFQAARFLAKLTPADNQNRATSQGVMRTVYPALISALREAGPELGLCLNVPPRQEEGRLLQLIEGQREESGITTPGIKIRIAVASLCALAYYRRRAVLRPIRIIGHSRGGSVAVGIHNVLAAYGIKCERTLTLDPCHGATKGPFTTQKEYFHKVWTGSLVNIPCAKNVSDLPDFATFRPAITVGTKGQASVTNHERLKKIKHGHMGKLRALSESEKEIMRSALTTAITPIVTQRRANVQLHLNELFLRCTVKATADFHDRVFIQSKVIQTLTT